MNVRRSALVGNGLDGAKTILAARPGREASEPLEVAIAPVGVPRRVIEMLNREINAVMQTADIREKAARLGLDTYSEPPEYFAETMRRDYEKWGKLVREIGFTPR